MKYLLDTNILAEPVKALPDQQVMQRLQIHSAEIVTATLVLHELYFGCCRMAASKKRRRVERYIEEVVIPTIPALPYDEKAALYHAKERARLQSLGKTPAFVDGQIAAIAQANGLILVTRNSADFQHFNHLAIESWHTE